MGYISVHACLKILTFTCSQSLNLLKNITTYQSVNHYDELNQFLLKTDLKKPFASAGVFKYIFPVIFILYAIKKISKVFSYLLHLLIYKSVKARLLQNPICHP